MPRFGRCLRTLFALLLAGLVLVQGVGVARAMSMATVHCCCGVHSIARMCNCLRCPVKLKRAAQQAQVPDEETLRPVGSCSPSTEDGALLVLATLVERPRLSQRAPVEVALLSHARPLEDRPLETPRPPP